MQVTVKVTKINDLLITVVNRFRALSYDNNLSGVDLVEMRLVFYLLSFFNVWHIIL